MSSEPFPLGQEDPRRPVSMTQARSCPQRLPSRGDSLSEAARRARAVNKSQSGQQIPGPSSGFGRPPSGSGERFPELLAVGATDWAAGATAVKFFMDKLGGGPKGKKIA